MTEPRYQRVITLTETEDKQLESLIAKKVKIVDVFRRGLRATLEE